MPWTPAVKGVLTRVRGSLNANYEEISVGGQLTPYGVMPWWMPKLWEYNENVGEFHNASTFLASCMSRCTLRLGVYDEDNRRGPAFEENGEPVAGVDPALARLGAKMISSLRALPPPNEPYAPAGGQAALLSRMGANLGTVGECFLLGWQEGVGKDRVYRWEVVSTEEIRALEPTKEHPLRFYRRRTRYTAHEIITPSMCIRIYRSSARFSGEPDTGNRALMDTLEQLYLLSQEGVANSQSRLMNGVLLYPTEVEFVEDENGKPLDVGQELQDTATIAITDPRAASRAIPLAMGVPGEQVANFKHLKLGEDGTALVAKRDAAVTDFARGSEFPPEVTRGFGESALANAFIIDESVSRLHVEPWLDVAAGCLTASYLTPGLLRASGLPMDRIPPSRVARFCVWWDVSGLVSHTNPEKVANAGYGTAANPNFGISGAAWRRMNGVPNADAPANAEVSRRIELAHELRMRSEVGGKTDPNTPTPEPSDEGIAVTGPNVDEEIGKRVVALADYVVRDASKSAGAWLRAKAKNKPELSRLIDGIVNEKVAGVLGPQNVDLLGGINSALPPAKFDTFEVTVRDWLVEAGREDAAEVASSAAALVGQFTRARLTIPTVRFGPDRLLELLARPDS